jgi:hypothetical protein
MKSLIKLLSLITVTGLIITSCEGPMGPAGKDGLAGTDANETCKECHNPNVVDAKVTQFAFSKHSYGVVASEEVGNTGCSPCHESEAFKYMCKNNIPSTFTQVSGKYVNDYQTISSSAYGDISCFTCHSSLHTTYAGTDFYPLTTTAPVSMTMWAGAKTINLAQDDSKSNLCIKCHQPRPLTASSSISDGHVVDYASLASSPTAVFYDNTVGNAAPNTVLPSYRMHVHYGTVGAVFAGQGGVEFTGTLAIESSAHTTTASCQDCHMADITGAAGGHTFFAKGNFNGCNVTGCHSGVSTSDDLHWKTPRKAITDLLNALAIKIDAVGAGTKILHSDPDPTSNLWAGVTTDSNDGYLNVYDPSSNPTGIWKNPGSTSSYTTAQKAINNALPAFPTLKNVTVGAMINFQMCLREFSLGIHNYKYSKALLQNSIDALTAAGY